MPNSRKHELLRLEPKTLDAQFRAVIRQGLNCSPFETEAVVDAARRKYFFFLDQPARTAPARKISLFAVSADEPAGRPMALCSRQIVCLTLHRGAEDDRVLQREGPAAFRRARIPELCQEAMSQGALLTREDLAHRIFFVGTRTISRDLAFLRKKDPHLPLPLRTTIHNVGPVLNHRVQIVRLALEGRTTDEICRIMRHSVPAVAKHLATFRRCAQLLRRGMQVTQIAFLLHRSHKLVQRFEGLLAECERDKNNAHNLEKLLQHG